MTRDSGGAAQKLVENSGGERELVMGNEASNGWRNRIGDWTDGHSDT